jgi:hypothetical protein
MGIPQKYVKLCSEWYDGQYCLFYAVASSGGLKIGTIRPICDESGIPLSNKQWLTMLYNDLLCEINFILRILRKNEFNKNKLAIHQFERFGLAVERHIAKRRAKSPNS